MTTTSQQATRPSVLHACYYTANKSAENFVVDHVLMYIVSGTITFKTAAREYTFKEGDAVFLKGKQLAKAIKNPGASGEFKSTSIFFDQALLQEFSRTHNIQADATTQQEPIIQLSNNPLYAAYATSLIPYVQTSTSDALTKLKAEEGILLLLSIDKKVKDTLFDFTTPGKIDLESYMNSNFTFHADLKQFAYLTGRSLATFKRDFEKIYHTSPNKWLQQKRLEEARYLIKEKGRRVSDVYLEVGFEDLSHFSFAFKKTFGVAPSHMA
ncbi:MAG: AraC family transcriptional regulator [Chitinophagaceae bacterium]